MKPELSLSEVRSRVIRLPGRPPFMLARDLASLYRVPPSRIGWAVHRNPERFPEPDFCFRISREEAAELQSRLAISSWGGNRKPFLCFTLLGANMLSGCLKSGIAAQRAVLIIRAFTAWEEAAQPSSGTAEPPIPPAAQPAPATTVIPTARYVQLLEIENAMLRGRSTTFRPQRTKVPLTDANIAQIRSLLQAGLGYSEIERRTGRCKATIGWVRRGAGPTGSRP